MSDKKPFRSIREQRPFPFDLYLPEGQNPSPLVCITPLLGRLVLFEDLLLERWLARFFAANGLASAVMARPIFEFNPELGLDQLGKYLDESVARNRAILDRLARQKEIDTEKIGSLGISFGAAVNVLWAASDTRLRAHVLALGGGCLPDIFVTSRDPLMRSYLNAALASQACSKEELRLRLAKIFTNDPLEAAGSLAPENILLVLALFDRVIRFKYGTLLRQALRGPETVYLPLGHYTSILSAPLLRHKMLGFFKEKLSG